jgi:ADP-heptose:LPS heptosyltransferase
MSKKQKTAAVFLSAGLGDALLLIPLVKRLKKDGYAVTAIITSAFDCEALFEDSGLFKQQVILRSKTYQAFYGIKNRKSFDIAVVNYFAASRANLLLSSAISKKTYCNNAANKSPIQGKNIEFKLPVKNVHDAHQNLLLYDEKAGKPVMQDFLLPLPEKKEVPAGNYIAIQVSAGNNKAPYKTWPAKNWTAFVEALLEKYPQTNIVLLGDKNEVAVEEELNVKNERLTSLIGKTTVKQAMEVIDSAALFTGLDGGLMHAAAALNKPTFTVWGGSDPKLYGYETIEPSTHKVVQLSMKCAPCNSWIAPNMSKTTDPVKCPDFACLTGLSAENVFDQFVLFFESLKIHA